MTSPLQSTGYVYYARLGDRVKIGYSRDPRRRVYNLSRKTPGLVLLAVERGTFRVERERHSVFAAAALGGEWFAATADVLSYIAALPAMPVVPRPAPKYNTAPSLLARAIKKSGLSGADFAREVFGVSRRTLTRMLAGARTLRPHERKFLRDELAAMPEATR